MTRKSLFASLLLGASVALTYPVAAQVQTQEPGAQLPGNAPRSAKKPLKKPAPKKAESDGLSLPDSVGTSGSRRGASDSSATSRRIDPSDIADPYGGIRRGGSGSDVRPTMTPTGRAGIGGRF